MGNLLLQELILKHVDYGYIRPMTIYIRLTYKKKQIPTTNQRISFSINLKISEKTLTKRSLIGSKKKTTKL